MAHTALYNSQRPQTFAQIVGAEQEHVVTTLKNQIRTGHTAQAYLFCGSRGTGKTTTARVFARAINCLAPVDGCEPCGQCSVCREMLSDRSTDLIETDAASNTGVDDMRDLLEMSKYPPTTARHKVYIIDEVHMLSKNASNALLKTLEEPPEYIVFLLCTTEPNRLPATVLSRCQRFDFRRYGVGTIVGQMERILAQISAKAQPEALFEIARAAEGGMRDALSLLEQCLSYGEEELSAQTVRDVIGTSGKGFLFDFAQMLIDADTKGALQAIDRLMRDGRDAQAFAREVVDHLRALLVTSAIADEGELIQLLECAPEDARRYREQAQKAQGERLLTMMNSFMDCEGDMRWASQPRNALELCAFLCCRPPEALSLSALLKRVEVLEQQIQQGVTAAPAPRQPTAPAAPAVPVAPTAPFALDEPPFAVEDAPPAKQPSKASVPSGGGGRRQAAPPKAASGDDLWQKALARLNQTNKGLAVPLNKAVYGGREGSTVLLTFAKNDNMFLKMLNVDAKREAIAQVLSEVSGESLTVVLREISSGAAAAGGERTETITQAREIFGRENVDIWEE